jgi:cytochrome c-type biogenesis protein CcmH/NrfG
VAQLEQAVRLEPDFAKAHEFLGDALSAQGRTAEAAAHYQRALQIEPGNERARRALELLPAALP